MVRYILLALLLNLLFFVHHVKDRFSHLKIENYQLTIKLKSGVENNGFEPLTLCVQGRCSSQLS